MRLKHSYLSGIKMSLKLVNHCVHVHQEFIKNWMEREGGGEECNYLKVQDRQIYCRY